MLFVIPVTLEVTDLNNTPTHQLQVAFEDFKSLCGGKPTMAAVKEAGKYRQEGKTYLVKDGDIFHFQFNVTAKKK